MQTDKLRVAIISYGSIGKRHASNLRVRFPHIDLLVLRRSTAVSNDQDPEPSLRFTTHVEDVVRFKPHAVYICSPAPFHASDALQFCREGTDFFVEKPIGVDESEVTRFLEVARARQCLVAVGYNLRFHPIVMALRSHLRAGKVGRMLSARLSVGQNLNSWRPGVRYQDTVSARADLGGGAVLELSHEIDLALDLFGHFTKVQAHVAKVSALEIDVEDCVDVILVKDDRRAVSIHLDFLQHQPERTIDVITEKGKLHADLIANRLTIHGEGGVTEVIGVPKGWMPNDVYLSQQDAFWEHVEKRTQPVSNGVGALAVLKMCNAIKHAAHVGQTVSL